KLWLTTSFRNRACAFVQAFTVISVSPARTTPRNSNPAVTCPSITPVTALAIVTAPTSHVIVVLGVFRRAWLTEPRTGRPRRLFRGGRLRRDRAPLRSEPLQAFGRVDVGENAVARHLDLGDELGILAEEVLGAGVAGERLHLGEEAAREEDRVAALAAP